MGQGYSMTTLSAASASIDVPELSDLSYDRTLASARFMKSIRARSQQGYVFVKAVMKPYATFDVRDYIRQITEERNALARIPNALGYQRIVETGGGGFLVRQFMFSSGYDRISTRPFLEEIEKRWLSYQLLSVVRDCHAANIHHGDIKTENLLVTSWNWLYLTDFSSAFKPTMLPEDNPADFSFYFDTTSRRVCYIAPERFTSGTSEYVHEELNWAMDMFSVGCVIAEIFLEGPIFTLSQLFKYRSGDYSPDHAHINKIEDPEVRAMVLNMIELDPEKRYSAEQHLSFYKGKIFPDYFYTFLHDYMHDLTKIESSAQAISLEDEALLASDMKIERVFNDYDTISISLGLDARSASDPRSAATQPDMKLQEGSLLFLSLVSAAIRNTGKSSARLKALDLLTLWASRLPDEIKLDRVLPYIGALLLDESDTVKVAALKAMTRILESIQVVSPMNAYLFPEYIFRRLETFLRGPKHNPSGMVRAAYASCLASLAQSSSKMLDMIQAIRADGRLPSIANDAWNPEASYHGLYDVVRAELVPFFEEVTKALISDEDSSVRRALLGSVSGLCMFFGSAKSNDLILSHLNTYLNDKDWILRCAFYDALVGVACYVGTSGLEQFILPIMLGSITDTENFVVERILRSLSKMAGLGLFPKAVLWELASIVSRFLIHPSIWLREASANFFEKSCLYLSIADQHCIVLPILQPFLKAPILRFEETQILDHLKIPLPKAVLEAAINWATNKPRSMFWTSAAHDEVFAMSEPNKSPNPANFSRRIQHRIPPSQRDPDDKTAIETLHNFGMTPDDEVKLMALREYILRQAQKRAEEQKERTEKEKEKFQKDGPPTSLAEMNVNPQTVFFDQIHPYRERGTTQRVQRRQVTRNRSSTIVDALLDASVTYSGDETPNLQARKIAPIDIKVGTGPSEESTSSSRAASSDTPANTSRGETPNSRLRQGSSSSHRFSLKDRERLSIAGTNSGRLTPRPSAVNLLQKADTMKAGADVSTSTENAFGRLDNNNGKRNRSDASLLSHKLERTERNRSRSPMKRAPSTPYHANHSYTGNDPAVLRLLDQHLAENFAIDLLDFGDEVDVTLNESSVRSASETTSQTGAVSLHDAEPIPRGSWRPTGQLLTQFAEHTAAINRVVVSPDNNFFVTASDDGTCKVWDTTRLEKNITSRSRSTHKHITGSRVKALCFVEKTHTFVSAATDGSIHAVKVDLRLSDANQSARYSKSILVRDYQITSAQHHNKNGAEDAVAEHGVWLHHYRGDNSQSVLLVATSLCRILMIDMKNMELISVMHNPIPHGTPTTFCVDKKHHWLLLGTSHGILDLWDLRFHLRLRAFGIGGSGSGHRIDSLTLHPSRGQGKWVLVSCGGEITCWDVEKIACRELLRTSNVEEPTSTQLDSYKAWHPDSETSTKTLERFAEQLEKDELLLEPYLSRETASTQRGGLTSDQVSKNSASNQAVARRQPPKIATLLTVIDYTQNSRPNVVPEKKPFLLSAGEDRTIRYWDLNDFKRSLTVSSPMLNVVGGSEDNRAGHARITYQIPSIASSLTPPIVVVQEKIADSSAYDGGGETRKPGAQQGRSPAKGANKTAANGTKLPRNTIISNAQKQLLQTHLDGITDVCFSRKPYGCIVSVDRGGCIYVFQ